MSKINNDQNNQACLIQYDEEGAKFSQVPDVKLSFKGINHGSRSILEFGCQSLNKILSEGYAAEKGKKYDVRLSAAWQTLCQDFDQVDKASISACLEFLARMARAFEEVLKENSDVPAEGEDKNIQQSEQGRPNEVSKTDDSSSRTEREHSEVYNFLAKNNALPPEAVPHVDFYIRRQGIRTSEMRINRSGDVQGLNGGRVEGFEELVPTRNITISDGNDGRHVTITGEYCDESDNNTWKQFSCTALKEQMFHWQSVNNSLAKLARDGTMSLSAFVGNIPESLNQENVINATAQGEISEKEIQLKVDNLRGEVSISKIDGEKKIPLSNPAISQGPDSEHVIITAQDDGQQRSFVVKLSDLSGWIPLGYFDRKNCILNSEKGISLRKYLEKKGISLEGRNRKFILDDENSIERKDGKWYVNCFYEGKIYKHRILGLEIRKIPDDDEHVLIEAHNGYSGEFKVKLADLLSEDGWVEQKEE